MARLPRRNFLRNVGAGFLGGGVAAGAFGRGLANPFEDPKVTPELVQLRSEIEPVVRWIESTPRDKILEKAAEELHKGLPYRQLLAGLFLAGIRNIKPRPVGFKFHAVMVVESAHQLGLDSPESDRLLPLFWALDNFKSAQEADVREGDWALGPLKESAVPSVSEARRRFEEAMAKWDEAAADSAVVGFLRAAGTGELEESLWRLGARDWQNIGHKAIFTAHAIRTLRTIGWQHAEPVLRSLVYALLTGGESETSASHAKSFALAETIRPEWAGGKADSAAMTALLGVLRQAKPEEAALEAARAINNGVAASSVWDAVLLAGADLLVRSPGIVAIHAMTAANSLHFAFQSSGVDRTRLLCLLQACSWICHYREAFKSRGGLPDGPRIEDLQPEPNGPAAPGEIFQDLTKDRGLSARRLLAFASGSQPLDQLFDTARRLVFAKGTDAHDYKYASALIEESRLISPHLRPRLIAASAYQLKGASEADSPLLERSRKALGMV